MGINKPGVINPAELGSGPQVQFTEFLKQGRFMLQRSQATGEYTFYPRVMIPASGEIDLEWVEASGRGEVYSCTRIPRKPERGGDYCVAIVELEEGPRMMTNIEGVAADTVSIGMSVKADIVEREGMAPRLIFLPV
ncbi:OB-fold domain-containing protein [Maricurvus nonylphenolicus]|uniref:Zn-ribbon domain-containing OB-fold protein n=1 Tax=Maricurvus nonylphenolicus TaxID=1008307 RepID=UPI0036F3AA6D